MLDLLCSQTRGCQSSPLRVEHWQEKLDSTAAF